MAVVVVTLVFSSCQCAQEEDVRSNEWASWGPLRRGACISSVLMQLAIPPPRPPAAAAAPECVLSSPLIWAKSGCKCPSLQGAQALAVGQSPQSFLLDPDGVEVSPSHLVTQAYENLTSGGLQFLPGQGRGADQSGVLPPAPTERAPLGHPGPWLLW